MFNYLTYTLIKSIDLVNSWSLSSTSSSWETCTSWESSTTWESTSTSWESSLSSWRSTSSSSVNLLHYWVEDFLKGLQFVLVIISFSIWISINPFCCLLNQFFKFGLLFSWEFVLEFLILKCISDWISCLLETVLSFNSLFNNIIFSLEFLSLLD